MVQLTTPIDLASIPQQESVDFSPIPEGWYTSTIASADLRSTKAGTGEYIAVRFDVTGPTHQGRVVFTNLNIRNPNPKAEEIGRQQLGQIMQAIGASTVTDTDQLIGGNVAIKVSIKRDEKWGDRNEVRGFKTIAGGQTPQPAAVEKPPTRGAAPPWAAKPVADEDTPF